MKFLEPSEAITVQNVVKRFGSTPVVNGVSFSIKEGEIFGLLGSNGAGKTTLINMLTGLLLPSSGTITIFGQDVTKAMKKIRPWLALVPQTMSVYEDLTVRENLEFFGSLYLSNHGELQQQIETIISAFYLDKVCHKRLSQLSGGYQRRCSLGCALVSRPRVLFLDEPLVGIDLFTTQMILEFIKHTKDITIVITTHSLKEAESICNHVVIMDQGSILLDGQPQHLITDFATRYGEKIMVESTSPEAAAQMCHLLQTQTQLKFVTLTVDNHTLCITTTNLGSKVVMIMDILKPFETQIVNIDIHKPSLEDTFLKVTANRNYAHI